MHLGEEHGARAEVVAADLGRVGPSAFFTSVLLTIVR